MFASLLAASLASSLGRVGVRIVADMYAGRVMPNGSNPSFGAPDTEFERPLAKGELVLGTNADAESGSPRGWGAPEGAEGGPDTDACRGDVGVRGPGCCGD